MITDAVKHLQFKPINEINGNGNGNNNGIYLSTNTSNEDFYQKRQEYWERREKVLDERWEETRKWQQEVLSLLKNLGKLTDVAKVF